MLSISFHVSVGHLYVFFGKMLFGASAHFLIGLFVFLLLSCLSSLYILDINSLYKGYTICRYLLPFSTLPFCFGDRSFAVQKLF